MFKVFYVNRINGGRDGDGVRWRGGSSVVNLNI